MKGVVFFGLMTYIAIGTYLSYYHPTRVGMIAMFMGGIIAVVISSEICDAIKSLKK